MKNIVCNNNLPEWARGWLAGLIDGEGTITVKCYKRKDRYSYRPLIVVNNTSLELLSKMKDVVKCGTIMLHSPSYTKKHSNWNIVWRLEIKGSFSVYTLLQQIYPYLIVKRKHAEIVMKICEENIKAYLTHKKADIKYLEQLVNELKSLTKRGKKNAVGLDSHP